MNNYNISSVPIMTDAVNYIAYGVISATDILVSLNNLYLLDENVVDYVTHSRNMLNVRRHAQCVISLPKYSTINEILQEMSKEEIHHIYITENSHVVSVVSFVDILRYWKQH